MKKFILLATTAMVLMGCSDKVNVRGYYEVFAHNVWLLDSHYTPVDSATAYGGYFNFTIEMGKDSRMFISDTPNYEDATYLTSFLMEPGKIRILPQSGQKDPKITGTPANKAYFALVARIRELGEQINQAENDQEINRLLDIYESVLSDGYMANRNNVAGLRLLNDYMIDRMAGQEVIDELDAMPDMLKNMDEWYEVRCKAEQKIRTSVGQPYIDFTLKDMQGNPVSLKSVVDNPANRYVLLDFTSTACPPCMEQIPWLKEAYGKYHDKGLEIIGITYWNETEAMSDVIAEKDINWINVTDSEEYDKAVIIEYGITGTPTHFLIDCKTGLFIGKSIGGGQTMKTLEELFGE